jgi:hypothetical protein
MDQGKSNNRKIKQTFFETVLNYMSVQWNEISPPAVAHKWQAYMTCKWERDCKVVFYLRAGTLICKAHSFVVLIASSVLVRSYFTAAAKLFTLQT